MRTNLLVVSLIAVMGASSAQAQSKAVAYLVNQEIAEGCESKKGTIEPSGVIERDLDGDGESDLIVAADAIRCSGQNSLSLNCGAQICSVTFYLRRGPLLRKVHDMLGAGVSVGPGRVPKVYMFAHGGSRGWVRWNGRGFENGSAR